jgi:hypothetical protein
MPNTNFDLNGFQEDPSDERDQDFRTALLPSLSPAAGDVDLIEIGGDRVLPVSSQRWSSSCVANACADLLELAAVLDGVDNVQEISRLQIYYNARCIMYAQQIDSGRITEATMEDKGTFIRCAMKAIEKCGVCPEEMWPFDLQKINTRPKLKSIFRALKNRTDGYYKIKSSGLDKLTDFHEAIGAMHPVEFAIPVTREFTRHNGTEPIEPPNMDDVIGWHAIGAVGKRGDLTKMRNSWSDDWGDGGYAYLTSNWFERNLVKDSWVFTRGKALSR